MDDLSFLDASLIYLLLFSPLLSIILVLFWTSANMKNTAKAQLFGIVILLVLGFFAINSPLLLIVESIAIILLVVWIFAYKKFFLKGQFPFILLFFAIQVAYYILFFVFIGLEYNLAIILLLLCIIPIVSMMLLYPWIFGIKKVFKGRVLIIIVFIIQVIYAVLSIVLSLIAKSNL
ncbi:hypothetical protein [Solibacillus sp. FSL K6-4121]|uniref:hypothetical protein n=1 Tax=Solibacillus sp. FSL K6-4121 TaxID=2921505 RepID=UPI0030F82E31